jgi:hypothetical protein
LRKLCQTSEYNESQIGPPDSHRHDSRTERSDNWRVPGKHAKVTLGTRKIDLIGFAGKHESLGRYEAHLESGHKALSWLISAQAGYAVRESTRALDEVCDGIEFGNSRLARGSTILIRLKRPLDG